MIDNIDTMSLEELRRTACKLVLEITPEQLQQVLDKFACVDVHNIKDQNPPVSCG